jgi:hypothetical protein
VQARSYGAVWDCWYGSLISWVVAVLFRDRMIVQCGRFVNVRWSTMRAVRWRPLGFLQRKVGSENNAP